MHLTKPSNGKIACGRGIGNSHMAAKWDQFNSLPHEQQCEACAKSLQAQLNKKNDASKEAEELAKWIPEEQDAWMKADDALVASRRK